MAKIISDYQEIEIKDGDEIIEVCERLGVPFACYQGSCGICKIRILEGIKNLSSLTDMERSFGLDDDERLACQCRIIKGVVRIKID